MKILAVAARVWVVLALSMLATGVAAVYGEEAPAVDAPAQAEAYGLTDPADLEAFVDGLMAAHMPSQKIPAATVSVVKDGQLFFAKGYGFADREKKTLVVADRTLFRPGSISKLFTWTAVMQLFERGQIELDVDANTYLKSFQIPATYPEPITMTHLLTHTAGFEDGALGYLILKDEERLRPLAEALEAHIPDRVRPPGTWSSYSNFGTALAGLIVEEVSGLSFAEYIEKNIFERLSMSQSSFREPLPEALAPDMAVGYRWKNGLYEPGFFEYISGFGPAGALSSTATDMANFMIAHLQLGRFGDRRILEEATARQMQSRLFTADPRLPGMAHGFYESDVRGQHVIGHAGDTMFFHSDLALFTEQNVGLFVSYVTNGGLARMELVDAFAKRYFPREDPALPEPPEGFMERGKKAAGKYRFLRHNWSDIEKAASLPSAISVVLKPDGTLMTTGLLDVPWHWSEVEPFYYRQIDGGMTLAFKEATDGSVSHLTISSFPFMPAYRIAWYSAPSFNYVLLGVGLLLCVTTLVSALRHRRARKQGPASSRWAVWLAVTVGALTLLFVIGAVILVQSAGEELFYGIPPAMTALLVLPILSSVLTIGVALSAVRIWRDASWTRFQRAHYTLFALFAVGLVWFYWYWNILGFQYG